MDWSSVVFDWNRARAFWATAQHGSLSAAARALGSTQPTVGRQVSALEDELGVALFERTGRGLEITDAGAHVLEHVRAMGEAAVRVSLAAAGRSEALEGMVTIAASEGVATLVLPPILARLRREYPQIVVRVVASIGLADLLHREADIAVRHGQPQQAELVAKKIGSMQAYMYAAPEYFEARGGWPEEPADLADADFMAFKADDQMLGYLQAAGLPVTADNFRIVSENQLVQWELTKAGVGVSLTMAPVADPEPSVERVLPEYFGVPVPVWLVTHRELRTSRRVRAVWDLLAEELGERFG